MEAEPKVSDPKVPVCPEEMRTYFLTKEKGPLDVFRRQKVREGLSVKYLMVSIFA